MERAVERYAFIQAHCSGGAMLKSSHIDCDAGEREENLRNRGGRKDEFPFTWFAFIFVFLMFLLVSTGCTSILSKRSASQNLHSGSVLFADDFSKTPNGWGI